MPTTGTFLCTDGMGIFKQKTKWTPLNYLSTKQHENERAVEVHTNVSVRLVESEKGVCVTP